MYVSHPASGGDELFDFFFLRLVGGNPERAQESLVVRADFEITALSRPRGFLGAGPIFASAPGFARFMNPITASSVTFISKPAARARSRHASIRGSSATAAAMASDSSRANRFTTSSIRDLLTAAGAGNPEASADPIPGSAQQTPGPVRDPAAAWGGRQGSGAKFVHHEGFAARERTVIVSSGPFTVNGPAACSGDISALSAGVATITAPTRPHSPSRD